MAQPYGDSEPSATDTDLIDLYQLHWPNLTIPIEEPMLEKLVDEGKVRFIWSQQLVYASLSRVVAVARPTASRNRKAEVIRWTGCVKRVLLFHFKRTTSGAHRVRVGS